jgi:50S ribosomal protein L16 3-hydroxylase
MIHQWLAPMPVAEFVQTYLRKRPYAGASSAKSVLSLFGWHTLERLLVLDPAPGVLMIAAGKLVEAEVPRNIVETRALMDRGIGMVIRQAERHDSDLAEMAASFTRDIPGDVNVQLFVTPAGTHSFGWHYDIEDVFIAQTYGVKDYFFRDNTVDRNRPRNTAPDFERVRSEVSPIGTARLIAGDWLYIPARWWHVAKCVEDSLSISVGVLPASP